MADFPTREDHLHAVLAYVEQRCEALGLAPDVGLRAALIVEELFVNTVHHGACPGEPVSLELALEGDQLVMAYQDCGRDFDPFSHLGQATHEKPLDERPVGGLGVVLIDGFCSRRDYQRHGRHNRLRLWLPTVEVP